VINGSTIEKLQEEVIGSGKGTTNVQSQIGILLLDGEATRTNTDAGRKQQQELQNDE